MHNPGLILPRRARLKGKRVLITGASKGIGQDLAYAFAEKGCDLLLVARSAAALTSIGLNIKDRQGVSVETLAVDIISPGAIDTISSQADDIDIPLNNQVRSLEAISGKLMRSVGESFGP